MATIGLDLEPDQLILQKRRDFRWTFENLDGSGTPVDFPAGDLYFEIDSGSYQNALQEVTVTAASGGTYRLGYAGQWSSNIDYNDVSENPQGVGVDITDALEACSTIGAGNVKVYPVALYPTWKTTLTLETGNILSEQLINLINKTTNDFFDTFDSLIGVDIEYTVLNNLSMELKVTSLRSFQEVALITFVVDAGATAIEAFYNGVAGLLNIFDTINVDFYWNRVYRVEFQEDLAGTAIPPLSVDDANLTGVNDLQQVSVVSIRDGADRFAKWDFDIDAETATIKVESYEVDKIPARSRWQLVFLPAGEAEGGDPIARGRVTVQE